VPVLRYSRRAEADLISISRYTLRAWGEELVALTVVYSLPPAYTLTADRLTIDDRFYPVTLHANAIDAENIRIVDLAGDPEWRPTLRTNGFANAHYQSGWFRVAGGRTVRLYRAGGQRLVLIRPRAIHLRPLSGQVP
jgi:hypothetical protein